MNDEYLKTKLKINIRDIKSSFMIKKLFSFLNEKQKLIMIMYNLKLQKLFSFEIGDYKKISGIYKIGGNNGKGKEYYKNDKLKFEGEYLNGKRNGEGKEYYYNDEIKFEGKFLHGKRNGKGKEYYNNGKLLFDGE